MNATTLSTLSLVELKQLAKGRRIKQYYIMKRLQLIQILSLPELPNSFVLEKLTIHQLREEAKTKGVRGFWNLSRGDLLNLLHPDPTSLPENKNQGSDGNQKCESQNDCDPN
jgi:hypothetical protein